MIRRQIDAFDQPRLCREVDLPLFADKLRIVDLLLLPLGVLTRRQFLGRQAGSVGKTYHRVVTLPFGQNARAAEQSKSAENQTDRE